MKKFVFAGIVTATVGMILYSIDAANVVADSNSKSAKTATTYVKTNIEAQ